MAADDADEGTRTRRSGKKQQPAKETNISQPADDAHDAHAADVQPLLEPAGLETPRILASLPLQICIHLNTWYYPFHWLITLSLMIYKGTTYPYANAALPLEIFALVPWAAIEASRLFLGTRGNKNEEIASTGFFLGLTAIAAVAHIYYLLWQSYVLLFDVILNGIGLAFILVELITGCLLIANLAKNQ